MPEPGAGYRYTHADINALMLFPWPSAQLPLHITSGQLGVMRDLTWRQYLAVCGEFWERTYNYPLHTLEVGARTMDPASQSYAAQVWGLAVRALVERGYLNPYTGQLTPPVPFAPPPARFREPPEGWGS